MRAGFAGMWIGTGLVYACVVDSFESDDKDDEGV